MGSGVVVGVGVAVGSGVAVDVASGVDVGVGVAVGSGVGVGVGLAVRVDLGVGSGVAINVALGVGVGSGVAVAVGLGVAVAVGVGVRGSVSDRAIPPMSTAETSTIGSSLVRPQDVAAPIETNSRATRRTSRMVASLCRPPDGERLHVNASVDGVRNQGVVGCNALQH